MKTHSAADSSLTEDHYKDTQKMCQGCSKIVLGLRDLNYNNRIEE